MTNANLHVFKGGPAFSAYRLASLTKQLQSELPGLAAVSIEANIVFIVETTHEFTGELWPRVAALLDTDNRIPPTTTSGFIVTPRKGTLSPWASKATDIFHNCGLTTVQRVEHGILFCIHLRHIPPYPPCPRGIR